MCDSVIIKCVSETAPRSPKIIAQHLTILPSTNPPTFEHFQQHTDTSEQSGVMFTVAALIRGSCGGLPRGHLPAFLLSL